MPARRTSPKIRRARVLARLLGAPVGMVLGILYGLVILANSPGTALTQSRSVALAALLSIGVAGAASLALAAPMLTIDPYLWLEETLDKATPGELVGGTAGLIVALVIAALVGVLLGSLPWGLGVVISVAVAFVLVYVGVRAGVRRRDVLAEIAAQLTHKRSTSDAMAVDDPPAQDGQPIVVDTSALIDGRIVDVLHTGFIQGRLVVPHFVLEELQRVADSGDARRRARGRRGLNVADELRQQREVVVEIADVDFPGTPDVDARLVKLARVRGAALWTQDYNLNRLASAEGLRVLNLNDLANALKPIVAAGETLQVVIVKAGKEPQQGVGYLDDGTMVVVENARSRIDETVSASVTSVLQTPSGRMIFASVPAGEDSAAAPERRARPPRQRPSKVGDR